MSMTCGARDRGALGGGIASQSNCLEKKSLKVTGHFTGGGAEEQ